MSTSQAIAELLGDRDSPHSFLEHLHVVSASTDTADPEQMATYANKDEICTTRRTSSMVHLTELSTSKIKIRWLGPICISPGHISRGHVWFLLTNPSSFENSSSSSNRNLTKTKNLPFVKAVKIQSKLNPLVWTKIRGL